MTIEAARYVGIGEVVIGRTNAVLKATLGSCVGIAFFWNKGGVCGLAHCLLPESPKSVLSIGVRYVDQAVPSLFALMQLCVFRRS